MVFFIKTDWEGEIQDVPITFIFKVNAQFHITGMYKAEITIIPEVKHDKSLKDTPTYFQDGIIDMTMKMDYFQKKLDAKTAEELQQRIVEELPNVIDDALSCSVATSIMLPRLQ